jgi:hypothetical protein
MAPPTLLALPREIRNQIYSYLSKELEFDWLWAVNKDRTPIASSDEANGLASGPPLNDVVNVRFHNAPDPAVFATHSCLHAEYLEEQELPSEGLSARISLRQSTMHLSEADEPDTDARVNSAFAKVKHVTLNVDLRRHDLDYDPSTLLVILNALAPKLTNVKTLRITLQRTCFASVDVDLLRHLLPAAFAEREVEFLPAPPSVLAGLHTIQRGQGYRISYAMSREAVAQGFAPGQFLAP